MIDVDLGMSASSGARVREGFKQLLAIIALGEVGIVLSREPSRLSRTDKNWCHLMERGQLVVPAVAAAQTQEAVGQDGRIRGTRRTRPWTFCGRSAPAASSAWAKKVVACCCTRRYRVVCSGRWRW